MKDVIASPFRQVLNIDEEKYAGDDDMMYIIHRLHSAVSDAELRHEMNVEDEYFTAIENRDTTIMLREQKIKELDAQLAEKDKALLVSAQALKNAGIPEEQIAVMTTLPLETIRTL